MDFKCVLILLVLLVCIYSREIGSKDGNEEGLFIVNIKNQIILIWIILENVGLDVRSAGYEKKPQETIDFKFPDESNEIVSPSKKSQTPKPPLDMVIAVQACVSSHR